MITGFIYRILMSYLTWKVVKAFRCLSGVLHMCRIDDAEWKTPLATSSSQYSSERCLYTPVSQPYLEIWNLHSPDVNSLLEIFSCSWTLQGENGSPLAFLVSLVVEPTKFWHLILQMANMLNFITMHNE